MKLRDIHILEVTSIEDGLVEVQKWMTEAMKQRLTLYEVSQE